MRFAQPIDENAVTSPSSKRSPNPCLARTTPKLPEMDDDATNAAPAQTLELETVSTSPGTEPVLRPNATADICKAGAVADGGELVIDPRSHSLLPGRPPLPSRPLAGGYVYGVRMECGCLAYGWREVAVPPGWEGVRRLWDDSTTPTSGAPTASATPSTGTPAPSPSGTITPRASKRIPASQSDAVPAVTPSIARAFAMRPPTSHADAAAAPEENVRERARPLPQMEDAGDMQEPERGARALRVAESGAANGWKSRLAARLQRSLRGE